MNQHVRKTEKPKMKKSKSIQMQYPAPYSQSWSGPPALNIKKIRGSGQMQYPAPYSQSWSGPPALNIKKGLIIRGSGQKLGSPVVRKDTRPQLRCRGPDPTVPHLKYGLFPKKRSQAHVLSPTNPMEETAQKPKTPKEGDTSAPLFVVRSLDCRLANRLSRAASTHLDIKPQRYRDN